MFGQDYKAEFWSRFAEELSWKQLLLWKNSTLGNIYLEPQKSQADQERWKIELFSETMVIVLKMDDWDPMLSWLSLILNPWIWAFNEY